MVEVMETLATSFKRSHALSRLVLPPLHQAKQWGVELERTLGNCGLVSYTCI